MKKIIAIILALALVMSLSITAFAADLNEGAKTGDVTVNYTKGKDGGTIYRVDVIWGSMEFSYTSEAKGVWNPETHKYDEAAPAKWECAKDANKIAVTNHSNTKVTVSLTYNQAESYSDVKGTFDVPSLTLESAEGTTFEKAPAASAFLTLSGDLDEGVEKTTVTVGTITVTLNK